MQGAALVLGALIVAYVASRMVGLPLVGEHPEAVDAVGAGTKLLEALGLALAVQSIKQRAGDEVPSAAAKGVLS
jgi:hypothetical protein